VFVVVVTVKPFRIIAAAVGGAILFVVVFFYRGTVVGALVERLEKKKTTKIY